MTVKQRLTIAGTEPNSPFVADSTPMFAYCEDQLMSLHLGGRMGVLDLFNWSVTDTFLKTFKYMTYVRPAYSTGTPTAGHLSDPCATPNSFEFGTNELTVTDFGRYGRSGPTRDILKPTRYCDMSPRYRLDGSRVTSEFEWDLALILDTLAQDLYRDVITGDNSTAGKMDGLQQIINTGYSSSMLDSMVVDWNGNDMDGNGGGTITINGVAATGSPDLVDMLLALYRRFKQRISWSPMLARNRLAQGQTVLVMPTHLTECLLNKFTCWSVCPGQQYNEVNLQTYEARQFRDNLLGGAYGAGRITLDGDTIWLVPYDWETMAGTNRGDIYFLNTAVGPVRLWEGEMLSSQAAAAEMASQGHREYFSTDGGRVIGTTEVDMLCRKTSAWIRPRLVCMAPWLQARIMEVECGGVLSPISPDPTATSFYPLSSFGGDADTV